jgi:hypothetical protein
MSDIVPGTMNEEMCRRCAEWAFARWRGWCSAGTEHWAEKPDLPAVPHLQSELCKRCGAHEGVDVEPIVYMNVHGPFNTGLPDYFRLVIQPEPRAEALRWGRPYKDAWVVERIPLDELEARMRNSRYR